MPARALRSAVVSLTALAALAACAAPPSTEDARGASAEEALVSSTEKALVGSYRGDDPSSAIRGFFTKHPTRNHAFERELVFTLDVDPAKVPGLGCTGPDEAGSLCYAARIEGTLTATATTLTLTARDAVAPAVAHLLGAYRYTRTADGLSLEKVGAPAIRHTLRRGSYCTMSFDCAPPTPDSACLVDYDCTPARTCRVAHADPTCDVTWRTVPSLGARETAGTWTAQGAAPAAYTEVVLRPATADADATSSAGTFVATSSSGATVSGTFGATPENPAIGFAFLAFEAGSTRETLVVEGLRRDAQEKVVAMKVRKLDGATSYVYARQP